MLPVCNDGPRMRQTGGAKAVEAGHRGGGGAERAPMPKRAT